MINLSERDIKIAIASAIVAFVVAVLMLDMNGYIKHVNANEGQVVDEFKLLLIGEGGTFKVSPKSANKEAFCADGYLLIRPEKNNSGKHVAGLLVDAKDRAIPCSQELPAPGL